MRRMTLMLAAVPLALAACGGSQTEDAAKPVKTYLSALADGDGERACDQLTGRAQREMVADLSEAVPELLAFSCPQAVERFSDLIGPDEVSTLRDAEVTVDIDGERGTAKPVGGTDTIDLVKTDDGWLIAGGFRF